MRHHYSVTTTGLADTVDERFHSFEAAETRFHQLAGQAGEAGLTESGQSYWRREFSGGPSGSGRVALDDIGLLPCGPACGET